MENCYYWNILESYLILLFFFIYKYLFYNNKITRWTNTHSKTVTLINTIITYMIQEKIRLTCGAITCIFTYSTISYTRWQNALSSICIRVINFLHKKFLKIFIYYYIIIINYTSIIKEKNSFEHKMYCLVLLYIRLCNQYILSFHYIISNL